MEKALKTEGWTLLDFEGIPIAEGLPSKAAAVHEMLTYDGRTYAIRWDDDGGEYWALWLGGHGRRLQRTGIISIASPLSPDEAEAEIFAEVAAGAEQWNASGGYRILTDADRAAELAEDEDEDQAA